MTHRTSKKDIKKASWAKSKTRDSARRIAHFSQKQHAARTEGLGRALASNKDVGDSVHMKSNAALLVVANEGGWTESSRSEVEEKDECGGEDKAQRGARMMMERKEAKRAKQ
ncbi:unnamed protein product [Pleuronectes platessa]|uniref:Uncharacterized protein n=1 Tax=Pleuronectes platessa TaxID=8262 RepID=A0A9N7TPJ5_PLEPL|nr:unnamed protein product [Pleuronectes platessa]